MNEEKMLLKELGLTEYETKSLLTLLRLGIATAEQISEAAVIPLPRVYDTLTQLQKKGFILISKGRPKKFKPNHPKKAFKIFIENKKKEYDDEIIHLKNSVKTLEKNLSKIQPIKVEDRQVDIWSTKERKNIMKFMNEQYLNAKKEILIFSGDMSWLKEQTQAVKKAIKSGIKIRALASGKKDSEAIKNIRLAKKIGITVKEGYIGQIRGSLIDNKIAALGLKGSVVSSYELIIFSNPIIVNTFIENFNFWWKKL